MYPVAVSPIRTFPTRLFPSSIRRARRCPRFASVMVTLVCLFGGDTRGDGGEPASPGASAPKGDVVYFSPFDLAFAPDGATLAVSDRTAGMLHIVDVHAARRERSVALRGKPTGLAWRGPATVLVAEYDAGTLAEVNVATGQVVARWPVGPKPYGVALTGQGAEAIVCDYGLQCAAIVNLESGQTRSRIKDLCHPYFPAIAPDQGIAVVADSIPRGPASEPVSASRIHLVDLERGRRMAEIALPPGSSNVRKIAVSPDGRWAYALHTQGRVTLPTTQLERGWVNTNALSILDLKAREYYATVLLDTLTEGAASPWGIVVSGDGERAWITLSGIHQVATLQLGRLHRLIAGSEPSEEAGNGATGSSPSPTIWDEIRADPSKRRLLATHLSALYRADLVRRETVPVTGPRGIALAPDEKRLAVAGYYSGQVLLLDTGTGNVTETISLGSQPAPDLARAGEIVFHDATKCFQHWLSCSTCHPEGRADGLNWDLLNDGIGNPKNTRSLLLSHTTPRLMYRGVRADYGQAVKAGFQHILFREPTAEEVDSVKAFVAGMRAESSPFLVEGASGQPRPSEVAQRGKEIFADKKVGCTDCHGPPLYTDMEIHNVGTKHPLDHSDSFDTPTLEELWRTAPYLHDGSATTLMDVLTTLNPEDKHGVTSHLNREQREALVQYLLSL